MANNPQDNVIPGFEKLSKQELFDMAAAHILKNGEPSIEAGACVYTGIGCAASPFLTERGKHELQGSWTQLRLNGTVPTHEYHFVQCMQQCHDEWGGFQHNLRGPDFIHKFKESMRELAKANNLSPAILG